MTRPHGGGADATAAGSAGRFVIPGALLLLLAVALRGACGPAPSGAAPEEHTGSVEAQAEAAQSDSAPASFAGAPPRAAPAEAAEPVGRVGIARTRTNVRRSRSTRAPLQAVLEPGDTVTADSLERGWYRVALYGEVLGYAHQSTLRVAAPPSP